MIIILSGLPGVGKTAIARELASQIGAVHLRIDSIEQAMWRSQAVSRGDAYKFLGVGKRQSDTYGTSNRT
jgi:predicted kinase